MTAADYADWCDYAGVYLGNVSHADRYRTYQRKLSDAGLVTLIVHEFLQQNDGGIDLRRWRSSDVYEVGADAAFRVEQTALALEAVGAPRAAAKVRTSRDTSIGGMLFERAGDPRALREAVKQFDAAKLLEEFRANVARAMPERAAQAGLPVPQKKPVAPDPEIESWEQVEHLLGQYVRAHEQEFGADVEKFGDVRTRPGFDPQKRREELQRLYRQELDREAQQDAVAKMRQLTEELGKQLAENPKVKPAKVAAPRRKFVDCYREYSRRPSEDLIPAMRDWLQEADRFQDRYPRVFRPQPVEDEQLLKRLAEIGPYDVDPDGSDVKVSWDSPRGLECDWTGFSLSLTFPAKKKDTLRRLLDACDRLRKQFPQHLAEMRRALLEDFDRHRGWLGDWVVSLCQLDAAGNPTEASILENVRGGGIRVEVPEWADDDAVAIDVYFGVDWDDEHGVEYSIPDEPEDAPESS
jgi:hypothetical protein